MSRVAGMVALFATLALLQLGAPGIFPGIVTVGLAIGTAINVRVFRRLRRRHLARPDLRVLRQNYHTSLFLTVAQGSILTLGLLAVGRLLPLLPPETFLLWLSFASLLIAAPAVDWEVIVWPGNGEDVRDA